MRVINQITSSQHNMINSQLPLLLLVVLAVVLPQVLGDGYGGHGHGGGYGGHGGHGSHIRVIIMFISISIVQVLVLHV